MGGRDGVAAINWLSKTVRELQKEVNYLKLANRWNVHAPPFTPTAVVALAELLSEEVPAAAKTEVIASTPKRPRVSFSMVETWTYNKGSEDTKMMSSSEERMLPPLLSQPLLSEDGTLRPGIVKDTDLDDIPVVGMLDESPADRGGDESAVRRTGSVTAPGAESADVAAGNAIDGGMAWARMGVSDSGDVHSEGDVTAKTPSFSNLPADDEQDEGQNLTAEMPVFSSLLEDDEKDPSNDSDVCSWDRYAPDSDEDEEEESMDGEEEEEGGHGNPKSSADGAGRSGTADGSQKASFTYKAERVFRSGSFGVVHRARVKTGESAAIKKSGFVEETRSACQACEAEGEMVLTMGLCEACHIDILGEPPWS